MGKTLEKDIKPASIEEMKNVLLEIEELPENANDEEIKQTLLRIGGPLLKDVKICSEKYSEFGRDQSLEKINKHLENLSPLGIKTIKSNYIWKNYFKFKKMAFKNMY